MISVIIYLYSFFNWSILEARVDILTIFWFIFWEIWWPHKFILNLSDLHVVWKPKMKRLPNLFKFFPPSWNFFSALQILHFSTLWGKNSRKLLLKELQSFKSKKTKVLSTAYILISKVFKVWKDLWEIFNFLTSKRIRMINLIFSLVSK